MSTLNITVNGENGGSSKFGGPMGWAIIIGIILISIMATVIVLLMLRKKRKGTEEKVSETRPNIEEPLQSDIEEGRGGDENGE
jgi:uncharacterized membrane protein